MRLHQDTNSFGAALRVALRQDPDVVLIGEMRDLETIQAALSIAETGHLTLATLHTNSAAQTVNRIIDVFPADQKSNYPSTTCNGTRRNHKSSHFFPKSVVAEL